MKRTLILRSLVLASLILAPLAAFAGTDGDETPKPRRFTRKVVIQGPGGSFLGVGVADVGADRAKELKLKDEYGVEIKSVEDESPAAKGGLKEGDVVLEYNGSRVEGTSQFVRMVRETPAGRQVKLLISRNGSTQTINATVSTRKAHVYRFHSGDDGDNDDDNDELFEMPEPPEPPEGPEGSEDVTVTIPDISNIMKGIQIPDVPSVLMSWQSAKLGIESEGLGEQLAEFFGVKEGVLVRAVVKGSAAERAGLKAGDVITRVDGTKVSGPGQISGILRSIEREKPFPVVIVRNGKEMTVNAKLEDKPEGRFRGERMKLLPRRTGFLASGGRV